jgi:hypothetical protein
MIKPNFNKLLIFYAMPHKGQISRVKLDQSIKELALPSGKPVEKVENGTFDPIIGPAVHTSAAGDILATLFKPFLVTGVAEKFKPLFHKVF